MTLAFRNKDISFAFISIVLLMSINLWSFAGIPGNLYNAADVVLLGCLLLIVATRSGVFTRRGLHFKPFALLLILAPLPSMFGAALYHNQTLSQSLYTNRSSLFWLTYFALHILNIDRQRLTKLLLFTGFTWAALTIVQQFTYPRYYFFTRNDEAKSIYRAGVYRYMISGQVIGLFFLLHNYYRYLITNKLIHALFTVFGMAGFYYFGTRQNALAAAACLVLTALLLKGTAKWKNLLLVGALAAMAIGLKELLFSEYIQMTANQVQFDDDIRMLSAKFYLFDYWPQSDWAKLLGNGKPYHDNAYGREMTLINTGMRFFRSDVGIIGSYNQYGLLYVVLVVLFLAKGIFTRIRVQDDKYLKLFFYYSAILLLLSEGFMSGEAAVFFSIIMYMMDQSIANSKAEEQAGVQAQRERSTVPMASLSI